jgi:Ner family transcriptional regulator
MVGARNGNCRICEGARDVDDWHPEDIKAAIRKTGITLSALSESAGYEGSAARKALLEPWAAVEALIASHLGLQPQQIWPSRYALDGSPRRIRASSSHRSPDFPKKHRQMEH